MVMVKKGVWYDVTEKWRTYDFGNGDMLKITNVTRLLVSETGNHYVRTSEGRQYIVTPTWYWLSFEADDFITS